jgi:hypothetical protein
VAISRVEPKMQDLHMRFHSPDGTMEPSNSLTLKYLKKPAKNKRIYFAKINVGPRRVELLTFAVSRQRSNQLSYEPRIILTF